VKIKIACWLKLDCGCWVDMTPAERAALDAEAARYGVHIRSFPIRCPKCNKQNCRITSERKKAP
jgi:hypothetical protein